MICNRELKSRGARPATRCVMFDGRRGRLAASLPATVIARTLLVLAVPLAGQAAPPVYQPNGANLVYGDVTHGQRVLSLSGNPAAAAADVARREGERRRRGIVPSGLVGIEYGNVDGIFELIDEFADAFEPSEPGTPPPPGQDPDDGEGGLDLGEIIDGLDPQAREALDAVATEVATQSAILALIAAEGYARAFVGADAPMLVHAGRNGGAFTLGVNYAGLATAFGLAETIEFDGDVALMALEDAFGMIPEGGPVPPLDIQLSPDVNLSFDEDFRNARLSLTNDSSLLTKAARHTELNFGYSRPAWRSEAGTLYLGANARLSLMQLSRLSVRFGDITDSQELFDEIRNADFRSDTRVVGDIGALWVSERYQLGVQFRNINQPVFRFNDVDTTPYENEEIIRFLEEDQEYRMDPQTKLEASVFTPNRRWSVHLGYDVDAVTDPMGDQFQWVTVSAAVNTSKWWLPGVRFGWRQNLAGTELGYLGAGITISRFVNLDIASALESTEIDGSNLPRGLIGSLSFQLAF